MADQLDFSYWLIAAGLGGSLSGLAHAVFRAWSEGGGVRTICRAFQRASRHVEALLGVDFVGGCLMGLSVYASGVTEPQKLVELVNDLPPVGWAVVGLVGPALSGRLFTGGFVRGRYNQWVGNGDDSNEVPSVGATGRWADVADQAWRLRAESVATIEDKVWLTVQARLGRRAMELRSQMEDGVRRSADEAAELHRLARAFFAGRRRRMSEEVKVAFENLRDADKGGEFFGQRVESLGNALIDSGVWDPIEAFVEGGADCATSRRTDPEAPAAAAR